MQPTTLTVGNPTAKQVSQAFATANKYPVANRTKSVTTKVRIGGKVQTVVRQTAVRAMVLLAIATKNSIDVTALFPTSDADYADNRSERYHLVHRAVTAVEAQHGVRIKVTAFVPGTISRTKNSVSGLSTTKGEAEAVFITVV